jgi:hypothetical protein
MSKAQPPINHDYTQNSWGHAVTYINPISDTTLNMLEHGNGIQVGHTLTMKMKSNRVGQFKVVKISYFDNPTDMWNMDATFIGYTGE